MFSVSFDCPLTKKSTEVFCDKRVTEYQATPIVWSMKCSCGGNLMVARVGALTQIGHEDPKNVFSIEKFKARKRLKRDHLKLFTSDPDSKEPA